MIRTARRSAALESIFRAALARVDAGAATAARLRWDASGLLEIAGRPLPAEARLFVLAAGKAALPMVAALEAVAGDRIAEGLAVVPEPPPNRLARIRVLQAAHPLPDERSAAAGRAALALAARARAADCLVLLLSGGASSLLAAPLPGLLLEDVAAATDLLMRAGGGIAELNALRKHLLAVGGGRLAQASGAGRIEVLAVSDVAGDEPALIGSGPCAPDPSRFQDVLEELGRRGLLGRVSPAVRIRLEEGARGERDETPKPGAAGFERVNTVLVATNRDALEGAARAGRGLGLEPRLVTGDLRGEARVAGRRLAALASACAPRAPVLLLAGGETTVTVQGPGRGGRSQELALAAALALEGDPRVTLLAAGTDGIDGPTDAAGAVVDGGTVARGRSAGVDAASCLARNDAYAFFDREGGLLIPGPTGTNVMDLVLIHLVPQASC